MTEQLRNKPTGEAAWQPDIAEALSRSSDTAKFVHFRPIERANHRFATHDDFLAQIVVGGRGMGKSTLLTYRMRFLRNKPKFSCNFVRDVPPFGFRLVNKGLRIPIDGLELYSKAETWTGVWLVVLGMLFAYAAGRTSSGLSTRKTEEWLEHFGVKNASSPLAKSIMKMCEWGQDPHQESLHEIIQPILDGKAGAGQLQAYFDENIQPALQKVRKHPDKIEYWVLFVDNIDEALSDDSGAKRVLDDGVASSYAKADGSTAENAATMAHELWVNAQAGYASAAHRLRQLSGSMRMVAYGSARSEAYDRVVEVIDLTTSKIADFLHRLERDDDQLRDIFALNVQLMPASQKVKVKDIPDRHIQACLELCGYTQIASRSVFGEMESVYDLMRRHNFGTPRGLMMLGQSVRALVTSNTEDAHARPMLPAAVVAAVNKTAVQVFQEYRDTLYPPWDKSYDAALRLITSNVITKECAEKIEEEFRSLNKGAEPLFSYLYRVGLVGTPQLNAEQRSVQSFWLPGDDAATLSPDYKYLLVHPALAAHIFSAAGSVVQSTFYNRMLMVNPGAPCHLQLAQPLLRVTFMNDEDGKRVELSSPQKPGVVVSLPSNLVGSALLMVVLVTQRYSALQDPLHCELLTATAEGLSSLEYVSDRMGNRTFAKTAAKAQSDQAQKDKGRPASVQPEPTNAEGAQSTPGGARQSLSEFFESLCDFSLYGEASEQAAAVVAANALLKQLGPFKVRGEYQSDGNAYDVVRMDSQGTVRVSRARIEVSGLSGIEFRAALDLNESRRSATEKSSSKSTG